MFVPARSLNFRVKNVGSSTDHDGEGELVEVADAKVDGGLVEPVLQELRLAAPLLKYHLALGAENRGALLLKRWLDKSRSTITHMGPMF